MPDKKPCPQCRKEVAIHIAVCPFCGKQIRTQEEIDSDPAVKESIAAMLKEEFKAKKKSQRGAGRIRRPESQ